MTYQRVSHIRSTSQQRSVITDKKAARYFASAASAPRIFMVIMCTSVIVAIIIILFRFFIAGTFLLLVALICFLIIYLTHKQNPTDEEYDAWLEDREHRLLARGYQKHGITSQDLINAPLCIKSVVPPGSSISREYRNQNVYMKQGKDGIYRFSTHAYTYFFPLRHGMAIFRSNIQASPTHPYFGAKDEIYPYRFLTTAETSAENDKMLIENTPHRYSMEKLHLMFSIGTKVTLSAVVKAYLLDDADDAPESIISDTGFDTKLNRLRALLVSKGTSTRF